MSCKHERSKVMRAERVTIGMRRRRLCAACGEYFTTMQRNGSDVETPHTRFDPRMKGSKHQADVEALRALKLTRKEIAARLGISVTTVAVCVAASKNPLVRRAA